MNIQISRRQFVASSLSAGAALALSPAALRAASAPGTRSFSPSPGFAPASREAAGAASS